MNTPNKTITIARAIIRIGDAAEKAKDYGLLKSLEEMVGQLARHNVKDAEVDMQLLLEYVKSLNDCEYCRASNGEMSTDDLVNEINRQLARPGQEQVDNSSKLALEFEPTVHLVTANYAKDENGTTSGVSIALVFNKDGSVSTPRDHFLNAELLNYFNDKHQVNYQFIENGLPPKLQDYQLVAGTAEVREILPRELEVINFEDFMKISVRIKPNSRHREEVVKNDDDTLTVYVKAPAIEGRANAAAIKLLAKHFKVASSKIKLVRGATSKYKIFDID